MLDHRHILRRRNRECRISVDKWHVKYVIKWREIGRQVERLLPLIFSSTLIVSMQDCFLVIFQENQGYNFGVIILTRK